MKEEKGEIITHGNKKETYEQFVNKFKTVKTTDECYTPTEIYEAVKEYMVKRFDLKNARIERPFWPGGDYREYEYNKNSVVIDNPPFSKLAEICEWYNKHGIRYILFCPALTSLKSYAHGVIYIADSIKYENGAIIKTAFTHNMSESLETAPELNEAVKKIQDKDKKKTSAYKYPDEVLTPSDFIALARRGVYFHTDEWEQIKALDEQKQQKKAIYGGGALVSEAKAKEYKEALANAELKKQDVKKWKLSEREKNIIKKLGEKGEPDKQEGEN